MLKFDSRNGVTDSLESYLNGHLAATCSSTYLYLNNPSNSDYQRIQIGAVKGGSYPFEGFISDVRVFDTALSQGDITSLASNNPAINGNYAETFSTPVGWWKLNDNPKLNS